MARMLVIYKTPKDPVAFDRHYNEIHTPLALALPGLRKFEVSRGRIVPLAGARQPYLIAELHFDSLADIKAAFASDIGKRCGADRLQFAPDDEDVQMFLFETADAGSPA